MKMCVLTPTFWPKVGGTEMAVSQLSSHWQQQGHWVGVLTQWPRHLEAHDEQFPYPIRRYRRPLTLRGWFWGIHRELSRWHREVGFDVVTAHQAYPTGYAACVWGRKHGVPVVISCRGGDVSKNSRFRKREGILKRLQWCLSEAQGVTAISEDLAADVAELTGGRQATVIYNGCDPSLNEAVGEPMGEPWYGALNGRRFLLYMKRLQHTKGHDLLIEAYDGASREVGEMPLLAFAGVGAEEAKLRGMVAERGLTDKVLFLGNAEGDAKRWLLQRCEAFVHASWREGFGIVVLEAMACGRPILAAKSEGLVILVEPGYNGLLVEPGSAEALRTGLVQLLRDSDLRAMGAASLAKSANFRWDRAARLYAEAFEKACGRC